MTYGKGSPLTGSDGKILGSFLPESSGSGAPPEWSAVLNKPTTFTPTTGTTATTAAAGNDARLSNSRVPTAHKHPLSDITGYVAPPGIVVVANFAAASPSLPDGTIVFSTSGS